MVEIWLCLILFGICLFFVFMVYLPFDCIRTGIRRLRRGDKSRASYNFIRTGCLIFMLTFGVLYALHYYSPESPWHTRVLASGVSPTGREYVVMQKYLNLFDQYDFAMFIRNEHGVWHHRYLYPNSDPWRNVRVAFADDDTAMVYNNGKLMSEVKMPGDRPDWEGGFLPAEMTKKEVFSVFKGERW